MSMELTVNPHEGSIGWHDITVRDCVFEVSDGWGLDFSENEHCPGYNILVEGNTFKGAGLVSTGDGWSVDLEFPANAIIRNNTFWRCTMGAVFCGRQWGTGQAYEIYDNVFDYDIENGVANTNYSVMGLLGNYNVVTGNTITRHYEAQFSPMIALQGTTFNTVTGNTFYINAGKTAVAAWGGVNTDYTITPNTVVNP